MYKQIAREISRNGFYDKDIKPSSRFFEKELFYLFICFYVLFASFALVSDLRLTLRYVRKKSRCLTGLL